MSDRITARATRAFVSAAHGFALVAMLCGAFVAAPVKAQSSTREIGTLRVATFNTYLLSNQFRCIGHHTFWDPITTSDCLSKGDLLGLTLNSDEIDEATDAIANSILSIADEVDVIVLNEVWDERARDRLVARLSPTFPSRVSKVDPGTNVTMGQVAEALDLPEATIPSLTGEDSGLMLFAKRDVEFLPFASAQTVMPPGAIQGNVPHVRAQKLETVLVDSAGLLADPGGDKFNEDALASKAVAAVHVRHRVGGSIARAYILFTHLQADDNFDFVRQRQLLQIRDFVNKKVIDPALDRNDELSRVLVFGDINVDGLKGVVPALPGTAGGGQEWRGRFLPEPNKRVFFDDLWASTTSEKDLGPTYMRGSFMGSSRYDYALAMRPQGKVPPGLGYCSQHMKIRLEDAYSDHNALVSDFNQPFPLCSPRTALKPAFDQPVPEAHNGIADAIRIDRAGAMQWYRFPMQSAATVDVVLPVNASVRSTMFAADNLSRPIKPVEQNARITTYSVPDDFFIRIDGKTRTFVGDYHVFFSRRTCLSAQAPCVLTPTLPQETVFPANNLLGIEDTAWFRISITDLPDGPKPQNVSIMLRGLDANLKPSLVLESNPTVSVPSDTFTISGRGTVITFSPTATGNFLVKVARGANKSVERRISVGWDTNLTVTKVRSVVCKDETNGFAGSEAGEDEIAHFVQYDAILRRNPNSGWRDFDCNSNDHERADFAQTLKALQETSTWVQEQDDGSDNNDSPRQSIPTLKMGQLEARSETVQWGFEGGEYFMRFDRLKGSSGRE